MRSPFTALLITAALAANAEPAADGPVTTAEHLAHAARAACRALGREVAVAVVDASGQTLLMSRAASVGPHNLEAARRKAYTALSTRQPTLALGSAALSRVHNNALEDGGWTHRRDIVVPATRAVSFVVSLRQQNLDVLTAAALSVSAEHAP